MEDGNNGSWNEFLKKQVIVIFDDGGEYPKKKEGTLIDQTPTHIILKKSFGNTEALLSNRILRMEAIK